jgi:hypothetical protein
MNIERIMLTKRVDQAMSARRFAHHKLRIGDRFGHRTEMHEALFYLKLAREWKPKLQVEPIKYQEAAE